MGMFSRLSLPGLALVIAGFVFLAPTDARPQSELVIYKEGTKLYHRPGCPVIRGATDVLALGRGQAEARGYKPHAECDPSNPDASSPADSSRGGGAAAPSPTEIVYVDDSKYYHRKTCRRLKDHSRAMKIPLATAAKSHWPCPTCKAPILKRTNPPAIPGTDRRRGG